MQTPTTALKVMPAFQGSLQSSLEVPQSGSVTGRSAVLYKVFSW